MSTARKEIKIKTVPLVNCAKYQRLVAVTNEALAYDDRHCTGCRDYAGHSAKGVKCKFEV